MLHLSDRTVDLGRGLVEVGDKTVRLTTKEIQLLGYLVTRPGVLVARDALLVEVWGYQPTTATRAIDNMVRKLRVKIERDPADPVHLITVFGEGYRFDPVARRVPPSAPATAREVGRDGLVARIEAWLDEGRRSLCLVGPAGIGKSTVARRIAADRGGVWCRIDGAVGPQELEERVCVGVGAPPAGLERVLETAPTLLILDGCDVLDADDLLQGWVARWPGLQVVATSRVRRFDRFATVVEVSPLDPDGARALLDTCVARVRPDRPLTDLECERLLAHLDGWPAAIELAAARLRILAADALAERLRASLLTVLKDPAASSLGAMLEETLGALDPADQQVFARCAVFAGEFETADAEAVAGPIDALHRLVDHSLLRPVGDGRLGLLDPIREVAVRRLAALGQEDEVRERHLRRFLEIAEDAARPPVARHRARARQASDDVLAALAFALQTDPDAAVRLALHVVRELWARGHSHRRLLVLDEVLARCPSVALRLERLDTLAFLGEDVSDAILALEPEVVHDPALWAHFLLSRARIARWRNQLAEVERLCARASDAAAGVDAPYLVDRARSRVLLAQVLEAQGRTDEALSAYDEAIRLAHEADDTSTEGKALAARGVMIQCDGTTIGADDLEQALLRGGDDPWVRIEARMGLAVVAGGLGQTEEVQRLHDLLEPDVLRFGGREREGILKVMAAELAVDRGDFAAAEARILEYDRLTPHRHGHRVLVLRHLGHVHRLAGRARWASDALDAALALADPKSRQAADTRAARAAARAELDETAGAAEDIADAVAHHGADPLRIEVARGHLALAQARAGMAPVAEGRAIRDRLAIEPTSLLRRALVRRLSRDLAVTSALVSGA